jgi:pimeloyl-[acyl-carrier protein] methyl ester esterase
LFADRLNNLVLLATAWWDSLLIPYFLKLKHRRKINLNLVSTTVGQGPHIVLLHGWGLNSGVWQGIIKDLTAHFTITTIDLPGFGLNHAEMPDRYSLENLAQVVSTLMPNNAILLGWSLGGLVAQQIALSFPHKVKQLILLATSPCFMSKGEWPGIKIQILDGFKNQLLDNPGATVSRFLAIQAMGSPSAKHDIKLIKQQVDAYPPPSPVALSAGLELLVSSDLRTSLIHLSMPCQLLLGRLDSLVPIQLQYAIQQLNPAIKVTVFERSSHAPFISQQACFIDFLMSNK